MSEYEDILEEAFDVMGDDERLAQVIVKDEERETWLMEIEANLDEKLILRESPDKTQNKTEEHGPVERPCTSSRETDNRRILQLACTE